MAYRSVFIDGRITNPKTGNSIDLKVLSENETLPFLQSVTLRTEYGVDTSMSIVLTPTYEQALELISKDQEWLRLGNTLAIRWGYTDVDGAISDWHMGFMMLPEASFGEEITITIPAIGYGFNANRVARLRCWSTPTDEKTFEDVVGEICKFYGFEPEFKLETQTAQDHLQVPRSDLQQRGMTDLQFIVRTAANGGARVVMNNNKMTFVDIGAPIPDEELVSTTFQMYGRTDVWNHVFPMDSFEPETMGMLFLENHQGMAMFAGDPDADPEADVEGVITSADQSEGNTFSADQTADGPTEDGSPAPGAKNSDGSTNTAKSTVFVDVEQMQAGRHLPVPMGSKLMQQSREQYLNAAREEDAADHGIKATITSMAIPWLIPGMFVRLEGVGDYYSAVYMMFDKEVTIDEGGATMTCTVGSKGFPGLNPSLDAYAKPVKKHNEPGEGDPTAQVISENPYEAE